MLYVYTATATSSLVTYMLCFDSCLTTCETLIKRDKQTSFWLLPLNGQAADVPGPHTAGA